MAIGTVVIASTMSPSCTTVATKGLSQEDAKKYETLAPTVLNDLNIIVNETIKDSSLELVEMK